MHPALMWEELEKSYALDARRIWILNVGDIKPGEYLTQLFLGHGVRPRCLSGPRRRARALEGVWAANSFGPSTRTR